MSEKKIKLNKERSNLYPYYSLQECVEFIRLIDKLGGKSAVSSKSILSEMGIKHENTKSFTAKVSSSKQFGLIEKSKDLKLTERGRLILYPTGGEQQRKGLLIEAVKSAPIYDKLIKRYDGKKLPEKETLSNVLFNEMEISKIAKDRVAKIFISSLKYIEAINKEGELKIESIIQENIEEKTVEKNQKIDNIHKLNILLSNGKNAIIEIPRNFTQIDIDKIKKILEVLIES